MTSAPKPPAMRLMRQASDAPPDLHAGVVAVGNFDGVHLGHRAVIGRAREYAQGLGAPVIVLTFEPHPRRFFKPDEPPIKLINFRTKARLIQALGVDGLCALKFDAALAGKGAEEFVREVFVDGLKAQHIVVGEDFRFGKGRSGTIDILRELGKVHGFTVDALSLLRDDTARFSSSRVRECLQAGDLPGAEAVLGRPYGFDGEVSRGDQRGRQIGYPTANIDLGDLLRPAYGVYAVEAALIPDSIDAPSPDTWLHGVANLGKRPTVDGIREWFEVHLFDFERDIYGQNLHIRLRHFIRPERKFDSFELLRAQIDQDAGVARDWLAAHAGQALHLKKT